MLSVVNLEDKDQVLKLNKSFNFPIRDDYEKLRYDNNNIYEVITNTSGDSIYNLCIFKGTKDNRLINLDIKNISNTAVKTNQSFVENCTNYAFEKFDAETVIIFSNDLDSVFLKKIGYESLGMYNDMNTYVKDKEKYRALGRITK